MLLKTRQTAVVVHPDAGSAEFKLQVAFKEQVKA
jgi:hypothetical protein